MVDRVNPILSRIVREVDRILGDGRGGGEERPEVERGKEDRGEVRD